jgi:hypothetical protein
MNFIMARTDEEKRIARNLAVKKWQEKNKEKREIYRKEYMKRPEAKEAHKARSQKWRDENPEEQLKRSREQFSKFGHIYNAKAREKYNTDEQYRLNKLEIDRKYNATGRRKEIYAIPENTIKERLRVKKYHIENKEKDSEYNKKYVETLSDTLVKHRMGFKESSIIPKEIIEFKRLTIQLKRQLKTIKN